MIFKNKEKKNEAFLIDKWSHVHYINAIQGSDYIQTYIETLSKDKGIVLQREHAKELVRYLSKLYGFKKFIDKCPYCQVDFKGEIEIPMEEVMFK